MKKQNINPDDAAILRQKAEEQLKKRQSEKSLSFSEPDTLKLIHELQVHQIELEMQNEELVIAKEKTELAEEKYTELYDFAPSGHLSLSKAGKILELNFATAKMLGKERSKLINSCFLAFLSENTRSVFNQCLEKIFTSKEKQTCEVIIEAKDNLPIYVTIDGIVNQSGELCSLTVVDINERKQAEAVLLQSNVFNETLLKTIPFGMDIVDETGTVLFLSDNFKKIFGESAIGNKCWELYRDDKKQCSDCPLVKDITIGKTEVNESHGVLGGRIFEIIHTGMMYEGKKAMLEIFQDITEKVKKEQELILAKEKAEESDLLKSAFLANMSHEIRTPMNGILGFSSLLLEPNLSGEKQQEYIKIIEKSGNRMLNTINEIIDISKIESGQMQVFISEVDLNKLLEECYRFFKPEAEKKNIELKLFKALQFENVKLKTDSDKLNGILTNLVKNAIKYTKVGSIELGYSLNDLKTEIEFYVKDTGIGIPKDRQAAIFERFIQADIEDKMAQQGAGLGLAIARAYVEMLKGRIWVESEVNVGSTIYFTLPYKSVKISETNSYQSIIEKQKQVEGLKILIVEDDMTSSQLLKINLKNYSKEIIIVNNGKEAIKACQNNPDIDLVLMDIQLPEMNGYEATKQIREFNKGVIIIAQTAFAFSGDREKSIAAGCNDYISKPIKKLELEILIQKHINKS